MSVFYLRRPQPIDIHLATSRDGIHFTRVCRGQPFIPHGPLGYYDFMAMACSQPEPIIVNDTVYIYYAAANFPHNADERADRTRRAHVRRGAGDVQARPVRLAGNEQSAIRDRAAWSPSRSPCGTRSLFLNAATWMTGIDPRRGVDARLAADSGLHRAGGAEIQGDALDHPVRWNDNADLSKLLGKEIRLKFYMTRARLHAMTLGNEDRKLGAVESESEYGKPADSTPTLN